MWRTGKHLLALCLLLCADIDTRATKVSVCAAIQPTPHMPYTTANQTNRPSYQQAQTAMTTPAVAQRLYSN